MIHTFLLLLSLVRPVFAQDSSPELYAQYRNDYNYQYSLYQQAYLKYIDKKEVYTKYGTVSSQTDKFNAAKDTLIKRNSAYSAYLMALRVSLDGFKAANPTDTGKDQIELSKWEGYFREQNTIVNAINNDQDLAKWVDDFKGNYVDIQTAVYAAIAQGQVNQRLTALNQIKQLADTIRNSSNVRTDNLQWYTDIPIQSDLATTALKNAINLTTKKQFQSYQFDNLYPDIKSNLSLADGYLAQMFSNLKIIVQSGYKP